MKKFALGIMIVALATSSMAFAAENPVPTLYTERPVLISAPVQENVLGYDRLQVADTMKGYGRIINVEAVEGGYSLTIKDRVTMKELTLFTDANTRINTKMFHDLQLGVIAEVFYMNDKAIAINVLDKEVQEGRVYLDGIVESVNEDSIMVDGKEIHLDGVVLSGQAARSLKVGNRAQLVYMSYANDSEFRLKVIEVGEFIVESRGIVKEISKDSLHPSILVETEKGDVLLHVSDDTMMKTSFADYGVDDRISFTHSMAMTMSIPPQTTCYSVSLPKQPR